MDLARIADALEALVDLIGGNAVTDYGNQNQQVVTDSYRRLSADELLEPRALAVKTAFPDWAGKVPTQAQIADVIGASGASATSPVRKRLAAEAQALAGPTDLKDQRPPE